MESDYEGHDKGKSPKAKFRGEMRSVIDNGPSTTGQ